MDHSLARDPSFFFIPSSVPRLEVKEEAGGMLQPPPPPSLSLSTPLCALSQGCTLGCTLHYFGCGC